jgi:hypothetical protein
VGASADEIDRQIASTRDHLDANLDVLESRAVLGAKRAGVIAAAGLAAGLAIAGVAFLVYRRVRRPSPPREARPGRWRPMARKLAPALVSSAISAAMAQAMRRRSRPQA